MQVGVDDGDRRAPVIRRRQRDPRRDHQRHRAEVVAWIRAVDDRARPQLVGRVEVGVGEADHQQAHAALEQLADGRVDLAGIGLGHDAAVGVDLLRDAPDELGVEEVQQRLGLAVVRVQVLGRAGRDDEPDAGAAALDDRVRRDGRAEVERRQRREEGRQVLADRFGGRLDAGLEADRQVVRRRVDLDLRAPLAVADEAVGERAAGVDAQRVPAALRAVWRARAAATPGPRRRRRRRSSSSWTSVALLLVVVPRSACRAVPPSPWRWPPRSRRRRSGRRRAPDPTRRRGRSCARPARSRRRRPPSRCGCSGRCPRRRRCRPPPSSRPAWRSAAPTGSASPPSASLPSRIPSVSRDGDATDAPSMWSRPERERPGVAAAHELVERLADGVALAQAEPADPGGQALLRKALARERDPLAQRGACRSRPSARPRTRRRSSGSPVSAIQRYGPMPRRQACRARTRPRSRGSPCAASTPASRPARGCCCRTRTRRRRASAAPAAPPCGGPATRGPRAGTRRCSRSHARASSAVWPIGT